MLPGSLGFYFYFGTANINAQTKPLSYVGMLIQCSI